MDKHRAVTHRPHHRARLKGGNALLAGRGEPADPETPAVSPAFDFDLVCVAVGLGLAGIAYWLGSGDVETGGILFAGVAAYAAWLDGEGL